MAPPTQIDPSLRAVKTPPSETAENPEAGDEHDEHEEGAGKRPACFSSTLQECLFVLTATMSIGMSSFLYGICTVITAPIGRTLNMSSAQITWISASSTFVSLSFPNPSPLEIELKDHKSVCLQAPFSSSSLR
jgi:hypothetical protein